MANSTKKARKASAPRRAGPKRKTKVITTSPLSDPRVKAWDQLLRDPCAANLAAPCYAGADSGYLVRTTDNLTLTCAAPAGTVGQISAADYFVQITPHSFSASTGIVVSGINSGGALPNASALGSGGNFIIGSTVKRFRCIAACVKWVPSGPYGTRSGVVGLGYSPGNIVATGDSTMLISPLLSECQHISNNGMGSHEVRWLPTQVDENFTETAATNNPAAACNYVVLRGVDATYNTTTSLVVNGYLEVTAVWEWVPARTTGLNVAPKAPLPYTSQQVLSTIGDMGAYLFAGIRRSGPGIITAAMQAGARYLTAGEGTARQRAPNVPLIQY